MIRIVSFTALTCLVACVQEAPVLDAETAELGPKPTFQSCLDAVPPSDAPTVAWRNWWNYLVAAAPAAHSAQDVLATDGAPTLIPGKFAYGILSKDLEGEWIEVSIDDCHGGYALLGYARTDWDGRIELPLEEVPPVGEYGLHLRVMGDGTSARSVLRVYPEGTQMMVFDIDATLTASDLEVVGQVVVDLFNGDYVPKARGGALTITELRALDQRYELIYLTARSYPLTGVSRAWLADLGFPGGTLHVNDRVEDALWPGASADYKTEYLQSVQALGFELVAGYGNSDTDIEAYERAGIPKARTYIAGDQGGDAGTVAVGDAYWQHVADVAGEAPAQQPFQ